jgi:hypothetical protein
LREEDLEIGFGERGHEEAEDTEKGADHEDGAEETSVAETPGEGADEEEAEDLDGADPGDVRGGSVEFLDVVGLEDAEGVYETPRVY